MFIIRLASEALSLSEQNERQLEKPKTVNNLPDQPMRSKWITRDDSELVNLQTEHSMDNAASTTHSNETDREPNPPSMDVGPSNSPTHSSDSPNCNPDGEKNSILYDLLSGRENVRTACQRSRLFLFTTKHQTDDSVEKRHCDGMRRRKPLRPVKNINMSFTGSSEAIFPSSSQKYFTKTSRSHIPLKKLRLDKWNRQKNCGNGHDVHEVGSLYIDRSNGFSETSTYYRNGKSHHINAPRPNLSDSWNRFNVESGTVEQPLDLSAPKGSSVLDTESTLSNRLSIGSYSMKRFRRMFDGHYHDSDEAQEINNSIPSFSQSSSILSGIPSSVPTIDMPNPLISVLLNMLLNTPNNATSATNPLNRTVEPIYDKLNKCDTQEGREFTVSTRTNGLEDDRRTQPTDDEQLRLNQSKLLPNRTDMTRFLELYTQLACPRVRDFSVPEKRDSSDESHLVPHLTSTEDMPFWQARTPSKRVDSFLNPAPLHHSPMHTLSPPESQVQSATTIDRLTHPLVDRILSTLHEINSAKKNPPMPEPNRTSHVINKTRRDVPGPSTNTSLSPSFSRGPSQLLTNLSRKRPVHDSFNSDCLSKLKSDPIFNYLIHFIKHPEASLIDCFNPIHAVLVDKPEESWCRDAILQKLGVVTFQLLARSESERIRLFQDKWHMLYLLCVLECGKDIGINTSIDPLHETEDESVWRIKLETLMKSRKLATQLNMSAQMYNLLRGLILYHGQGGNVDLDTVLEQCDALTRQDQTGTSTHPKQGLLRKLLRKLGSIHKTLIRKLFVSSTITNHTVEYYLINWIQSG